jgi:hypothetical protein
MEMFLADGLTMPNIADLDEFYKTNAVKCPCCDVTVRLHLAVEVLGVFIADAAPGELREDNFMSRRTVTPEVMETIKQLRAEGVIDSFAQVYERSNPGGGVKNFERYFLTWAENATPINISSFFRQDYALEFGVAPEDIEFYHHASMVGVTAKGALRCFIARQLLKETSTHKADSSLVTMQSKPIPSIRNIGKEYQLWRRTKYGYIVGSGEFFKEMRKRSAGEFANTGI